MKVLSNGSPPAQFIQPSVEYAGTGYTLDLLALRRELGRLGTRLLSRRSSRGSRRNR